MRVEHARAVRAEWIQRTAVLPQGDPTLAEIRRSLYGIADGRELREKLTEQQRAYNRAEITRLYADALARSDLYVVQDPITSLLTEAGNTLPTETTIRPDMLRTRTGCMLIENGPYLYDLEDVREYDENGECETHPGPIPVRLGALLWSCGREFNVLEPGSDPSGERSTGRELVGGVADQAPTDSQLGLF